MVTTKLVILRSEATKDLVFLPALAKRKVLRPRRAGSQDDPDLSLYSADINSTENVRTNPTGLPSRRLGRRWQPSTDFCETDRQGCHPERSEGPLFPELVAGYRGASLRSA